MAETWSPTEAKIQQVLEKTKSDPRKLAIAYLRAQKRARDSDTAYKIMTDITDMQTAAFTGNPDGVEKAKDSAFRHMNAHKEISETEEKN